MQSHGQPDELFIKRLRNQMELDMNESKQIHLPFNLGLTDRVFALAGKYLW